MPRSPESLAEQRAAALIRRFLGHADSKLTERYAHLGPDFLQNVAQSKMKFPPNFWKRLLAQREIASMY